MPSSKRRCAAQSANPFLLIDIVDDVTLKLSVLTFDANLTIPTLGRPLLGVSRP